MDDGTESILDLPETEQERIRESVWAEQHKDCEMCGETVCTAGDGCDCGEPEGMRVPGTLTVAVHFGQCHVTYESQLMFEATEATRRALLDDVRDGLRVFRQRGIAISDDLIDERTNNLVTALLCNYSIQKLPAIVTAHWPMPKTKTRPVGHLESCECEGCRPSPVPERGIDMYKPTEKP